MRTVRLRIAGMTCPLCEQRVEQALAAAPGVAEARACFVRGDVVVTLLREQRLEDCLPGFAGAVQAAGYQLEMGGAAVTGGLPETVKGLCVLGGTLLCFLLLRQAVPPEAWRFFPEPDSAVSLGALLGVGFFTSLHCLAMCGGIVMTQGLLLARNRGRVFQGVLSYQAGRMISYAATGAAAGFVGRTLSLSPAARGVIMLFAGGFMLVMALNMLGCAAFLPRLRLPHPRRLLKKPPFPSIGSAAPASGAFSAPATRNGRLPFAIGLANGLMPCGPLQAMQMYALGTGSAWGGACAMAVFCLGTMPALSALWLGVRKLNGKVSGVVFRFSAALVILLGFGMLQNGLILAGIELPNVRAIRQSSDQIGVGRFSLTEIAGEKPEGAVARRSARGQEVTSTADYGSYEPIVVRKGLPVVWTLVVPQGRLNGCNNEISAPGLGIGQKLVEGNNVIVFIPEKNGVFPFSCWMGMIHSRIVVVDEM